MHDPPGCYLVLLILFLLTNRRPPAASNREERHLASYLGELMMKGKSNANGRYAVAMRTIFAHCEWTNQRSLLGEYIAPALG